MVSSPVHHALQELRWQRKVAQHLTAFACADLTPKLKLFVLPSKRAFHGGSVQIHPGHGIDVETLENAWRDMTRVAYLQKPDEHFLARPRAEPKSLPVQTAKAPPAFWYSAMASKVPAALLTAL